MPPLDPHHQAVRSDLADIRLAGQVFVPHYVDPMAATVLCETALYPAPDTATALVATLASGQAVELFERTAQWCWVRVNGQVGYCAPDAIALVQTKSH